MAPSHDKEIGNKHLKNKRRPLPLMILRKRSSYRDSSNSSSDCNSKIFGEVNSKLKPYWIYTFLCIQECNLTFNIQHDIYAIFHPMQLETPSEVAIAVKKLMTI